MAFDDLPPFWFIAIVSIFLIAAAVEAGSAFGRRVARAGGDNVSTIEAASLGLLALIIGFTIAISIDRYDSRRDALVREANAIGTVALRASLAEPPAKTLMLELLSQYAQTRLEISGAVRHPQKLEALVSRSDSILNNIWNEAAGVARADASMVPGGLLIQSLNDLIDAQEIRFVAATSHVPRAVLFILYAIAVISLGFSGYACGVDKTRKRYTAHILGLLVAAVLLLIQDLDRPGSGFIKIDQRALLDAQTQIKELRAVD